MTNPAGNIEVRRYDPAEKTAWGECVLQSQTGHFMHTRDYMEYHRDRFQDHSYVFFKAGKLIAVFPANAAEDALVSHQGLTFGGIILGDKARSLDVMEMVAALQTRALSDGFKRIVVKVMPDCFAKSPRHEMLYAFHAQGWKLTRRDLSSVINLHQKPAYNNSKKQNIKKGQRAGLTWGEETTPTRFWPLLESVLAARHDVNPTHSLSEITFLKQQFSDNIRIFTVSNEGALLAGTVLFLNNGSVHTQYLAAGSVGREFGALDFLLDQLITKYRATHSWFSFGISTEHAGTILNDTLIFSKEAFGARGVTHDFYTKIL